MLLVSPVKAESTKAQRNFPEVTQHSQDLNSGRLVGETVFLTVTLLPCNFEKNDHVILKKTIGKYRLHFRVVKSF